MKIEYVPIAALLLSMTMGSCRDRHEILYDKMRGHIEQIKIIDTHEHQGYPWKPKHNAFDIGMYMYPDLISSGLRPYSDSMDQAHNAEDYWEYTKDYLRFSRATSYHAQFIKNLQTMYGLKASTLSKEEFLRISAQVDSNANNYASWLNHGLEQCNIEYMLVDRVWDPYNPVMEDERFGYVFRFDRLVLEARDAAVAGEITERKALELINEPVWTVSTFEDYLAFVDKVFVALRAHDVVALKMGLAYHRSLDFHPVDYDLASAVFEMPYPGDADIRVLEDFLVFYMVGKAQHMDLPVQIHTGYLHGNYGQLDRGRPMLLLPLIRKYRDVRFILFHGGYPWTGEYVVIGKNYPNVYLDMVWLPQLSRTRAISVLHEMLDAVPYNKICWGGDVGKIEEAAGSLEMGKEVVATVLAQRIERGWLTEQVAEDICRRIFRENAMDIFKLDKIVN